MIKCILKGNRSIMEYSIEDKLNMSVERLCQEQKADFLNDLSEKAEVIHRSLWSITIKDGSNIYKMYYYDNLTHCAT